MAKQIEGVYEAVLECAKKEFLEKGYKDASLRTIAQEAGTSTSSIYTRFGDKEGLFRAIVEPVAEEMRRMFLEIQENFHQSGRRYPADRNGPIHFPASDGSFWITSTTILTNSAFYWTVPKARSLPVS